MKVIKKNQFAGWKGISKIGANSLRKKPEPKFKNLPRDVTDVKEYNERKYKEIEKEVKNMKEVPSKLRDAVLDTLKRMKEDEPFKFMEASQNWKAILKKMGR